MSTEHPKSRAIRCTAKSKASGQRCKRAAIPGGTVCRFHGGAAPQVVAAAKVRLAALVDPAIDRLAKLIKIKNPGIALGAVKDVLDRNGFKPSAKVDPTPEGGLLISWQDSE
jgi:hypothetical protein